MVVEISIRWREFQVKGAKPDPNRADFR